MAYKNLTPPITNPQAAQRLADTQAIRARAAVQAQPQTAPITQAAQATGAALTGETAKQSLQQQQTQAGLAKGQAGLQLGQQRLGQQQRVFDTGQALKQSQMKLDQSLFNINQDAANKEQQLRLDFNNRVAQTGYLQDIELANWALTNAQNEEDFKDKMQSLEQAHSKKSAMVNHAYQITMQNMKQEAEKASGERRQQLQKELAEIKAAWDREAAKQKAEAANRSAMFSAGGTMLGVGVAGAAIAMSGGTLTPLAPVIIPASASVGGSFGTLFGTMT